jgi:hypothetical protein
MTFNFEAAPDSHVSTPHVPTVLALEREIASEVLVVSSTG